LADPGYRLVGARQRHRGVLGAALAGRSRTSEAVFRVGSGSHRLSDPAPVPG
jgi:hypothetical protein